MTIEPTSSEQPVPAFPRRHDRQFFYKYTNVQVAQLILANCSIRWSSPLRFNDAFDVARVVEFGYTADELMTAVRHGVADIIAGGADDLPFAYAPVKELLAAIRGWVAEGRLTFARSAEVMRNDTGFSPALQFSYIQEQWDLFLPRFRILCLTTLPDSTQMWAYYADDSRGVAFEFQALDSFANPLLAMRPVTYQDEPPTLTTKDEFARHMLGLIQLDLGELYAAYEYTKARNWQHEMEWRLVEIAPETDTQIYSDVGFDPRLLRRVIFGPNCVAADRSALLEQLAAPHWAHVGVATVARDYARRRLEIVAMDRSA